MKKIILSLVAFTMFFAVGCSEESATDFNAEATSSDNMDQLAGRSSAWYGEIGVDVNGVFKITADEQALKDDLTATLRKEGKNTTVTTLTIEKLTASNDSTDAGYMLIGTDGARNSIGVWLVRDNIQFFFDTSFTNSTSCEGCAQGCNLSYLRIDGKRIAFCNENGCTYDCTKTETSYQ